MVRVFSMLVLAALLISRAWAGVAPARTLCIELDGAHGHGECGVPAVQHRAGAEPEGGALRAGCGHCEDHEHGPAESDEPRDRATGPCGCHLHIPAPDEGAGLPAAAARTDTLPDGAASEVVSLAECEGAIHLAVAVCDRWRGSDAGFGQSLRAVRTTRLRV